jgi:hypothetical protein
VTPAGFGFAGAVPIARRYAAPFHLGVVGMPGALSPWLPHPAKNAHPANASIVNFLKSSSSFLSDDAQEYHLGVSLEQ